MRLLAAFICLLICAGNADAADGYLLRVQTSSAVVTVGDRIYVTITIVAPAARVIKLAEPPQEEASWTALDVSTNEEVDLAGARRLVRRFTIVPFAVGDLDAPSLAFEIIDAGGQAIQGMTPAVPLLVRSVSPDPEGPRDSRALKDVIRPPEDDNTLIIAGAGTALLFAAFALWRISRRRRPASIERLLRLSPADRALRDLDRLAVPKRIEKGEGKALAGDITDILRRYLGLRYHIFALEMTSAELLDRFVTVCKGDETNRERLGAVLSYCDLVKFARHEPRLEAAEDTIVTARSVISATREETFAALAERAAGGKGGR